MLHRNGGHCTSRMSRLAWFLCLLTASLGGLFQAHSVTFNAEFESFTTESGFNHDSEGPARRQAVFDVLAQLESLIQDAGECDVLFTETNLAATPLMVSAQSAYSDQSPGYHAGDAYEHIVNGVDPNPSAPDLTVFVRFDVAWYTDVPICYGCGFDLRTHLLAEVLAGLGLQSAIDSDGSSAIAPGVYTLWDRLLMTGRGDRLLELQSGTPVFVESVSVLTDTQVKVRFDGAQTADALGEPPFLNITGLFVFEQSLQHFAQQTTLNAVMEPLASATTVRRRLTPVDIGALRDIGYDVDIAPADVIVNTLTDTVDGGDSSSVDALNQTPGTDGISLREAIFAANNTLGPQIIRFGVSGVILPASNLPELIDDGTHIEADGSVTLDFSMQTGDIHGIVVQNSQCVIRGLRLINAPGYNLALRSYGFGFSSRVLGCWVGLNSAGAAGSSNHGGILIQDSSSNVIGGTVSSARNVISALEQDGIRVQRGAYSATGNVILGNYIGLNPAGTAAIANSVYGINIVDAPDTLVGDLLSGGRNVFGANTNAAIHVAGTQSAGTRIVDNYIGISADGTTGLANGGAGILIEAPLLEIGGTGTVPGNVIAGGHSSGILATGADAKEQIIANNRIGLSPGGQRLDNSSGIVFTNSASSSSILDNIIAASSTDGILLDGAGDGIVIERNSIGTDGSASSALGNLGNGIRINNTESSIIGSVAFGGNVIAHNLGAGVRVEGTSDGNEILNNSIFDNGEGGIVIVNGAHPGATAPIITSLDPLEGTAPPNSTVEFFADDNAQGRLFITRYFLDNSGAFSLIQDLSTYDGLDITATATLATPRSTSMFSEPKPVDLTEPVITILGANPLEWEAGIAYVDPGATASDIVDGDLTNAIQVDANVNVLVPGDYTVTYRVSDTAGNEAMADRDVTVADTLAPVLALLGPDTVTVVQGQSYVEPGYSATDILEGDLTDAVGVSGTVDTAIPGDYLLTYTVTDGAGNSSVDTRTVRVVSNAVPRVDLSVDPIAAPAGTPFEFSAVPLSDTYIYAWDFAGFGSSDVQNPTFSFVGAAPGSYEVSVLVEVPGGASETFSILVTVTEDSSAGSGRVDPDAETIITVDDGPLEGAQVIIPPGALDEPVVIAISQVENPPAPLPGMVSLMLRLEPSGLQFDVPVTVRAPHSPSWYHQDSVEAVYYSVVFEEWRRDGVTNARHGDAGAYHYIEFETTHFTVFMAKSLVPSGIQGQVFSTEGDELTGATVTIDPAGLNLVCDAAGFYTTIADLEPGTYNVAAEKAGTHCEAEETVNVGTAELVRQDFELEVRNNDGSCGGGGGGGGCHGDAPNDISSRGAKADILLLTLSAIMLAALRNRRRIAKSA